MPKIGAITVGQIDWARRNGPDPIILMITKNPDDAQSMLSHLSLLGFAASVQAHQSIVVGPYSFVAIAIRL
jgi:hypothetical protein